MAGFSVIEGDVFLNDKDGNGITSEPLDQKQLLHVLAIQEHEHLELARAQQNTLSHIESMLQTLIEILEDLTSE